MSGKSTRTLPVAPEQKSGSSEGAREGAVSNADQQNAMYQSNYEGFYGSWLGGKAWDAVGGALAPDKIDGYAAKGFGSAGSWLGDRAVENARPEDLAQAQAFKEHISGAFRDGYGERFASSGISEGIHDFVGNNPWSVLAGGALGLGAAYAADVDLGFDTSVGLGKKWDLNLGADLGSAQDIGFDAARAGLEFSPSDRTKLGVKGEYRFDNGDYSAGIYGQHRTGSGGLLKGNLDYSHAGEVNTTSGALSYHQPGQFMAGLDGSHVDNAGQTTDQINGRIRTDWGPENPWKLEAGMGWHSEKGTNAFGRASYKPSDNFSFDAGVSHSSREGLAANVGLSYRF
ncbi:MAG: hypothetical protein R3F61_02335 [Myxococcota bacterium]